MPSPIFSKIAAFTPFSASAGIVPIGDSEKAGIVKSSDQENKVSIAGDGIMEVVSLNVNKLVQDENTFIVLDGNS